jgi:periplasmic mercuric ion binding protein
MKNGIFFLLFVLFSQTILEAQSIDNDKVTLNIKTSAQCSQCKDRIESAMIFEKGIKSVNLDLETKILTVVYKRGKNSDENIRLAVAKLGYDADNIKKNEKAYKNLPSCCKLPEDGEHKKH